MQRKWLRAISRDISPTKNTRVCSLHFTSDDFVTERRDTNLRRLRGPLRRKMLKEGAVPSVFPNYPEYLQRPRQRQRSGASSSSQRLEAENTRIESEIENFEESDVIEDLNSLLNKFNESLTKPSNFFLCPSENREKLVFLNVDTSAKPTLCQSVTVFDDLSFVVYDNHHTVIPPNVYETSMRFCKRILRFSDFLNLLASVASVSSDPTIETVLNLLNTICETETVPGVARKLAFLTEQLELVSRPPGPLNRYSMSLVTTSILWKAHSTACYKSILQENVLTLPSIRTLRRIGQKFSHVNDDTLKYLQLRASKLNSHEKTVILLFDEIHVFQSIDYKDGAFVGLAADSGEPAKTILCFMIKSLSSKYSDIVAAIPTHRLVMNDLKKSCLQILEVVMKAGFNVIALCCDNHPVNRSFYNDLSCGDINAPCSNPCDPDKKLFLLLDPIHTIKNVYNLFQKRCVFDFPKDQFSNVNFSHVKDMYNLESEMSLRKAHKLTSVVFNPTNIQRTSAKLAFSLFHESTVAALRYYSIDHPHWQGTCDFLSYIADLVKILNIRSSTVGGRRREDLQLPFSSNSDERLDLLLNYANFFEAWRSSRKPGLSAETFTAVINACFVVRQLILHLLEECDFKYAITGYLQSDAIESRFGQYRQMSGGNFFVSVTQVLESEKKIKLVSLLKHSGIALSTIVESNEIDVNSAPPLNLDFVPECDISESEQEIVFYVSGYCANKIRKNVSCSRCLSFVLSETNLPLVDQPTNFFKIVNRGGLKCPADDTYEVCCTSYRIFCMIKESQFDSFLRLPSPRDTFVSTVLQYLHEKCVCAFTCANNHDVNTIWQKIIVSFFNCLIRNFLRSVNTKDAVEVASRKIHKLRSQRK